MEYFTESCLQPIMLKATETKALYDHEGEEAVGERRKIINKGKEEVSNFLPLGPRSMGMYK